MRIPSLVSLEALLLALPLSSWVALAAVRDSPGPFRPCRPFCLSRVYHKPVPPHIPLQLPLPPTEGEVDPRRVDTLGADPSRSREQEFRLSPAEKAATTECREAIAGLPGSFMTARQAEASATRFSPPQCSLVLFSTPVGDTAAMLQKNPSLALLPASAAQ